GAGRGVAVGGGAAVVVGAAAGPAGCAAGRRGRGGRRSRCTEEALMAAGNAERSVAHATFSVERVYPAAPERVFAAFADAPTGAPRPSHRARLDGLAQCGGGFARGDELVRDEAREAEVRDGGGDRAVVQLLRAVQLVAAGHAGGVEMRDVLAVVADGADDVALHDLHVVDVVEQLHAWRRDGLDHTHAERGRVAVIVLVVDLAVQHLEADRDAVLF